MPGHKACVLAGKLAPWGQAPKNMTAMPEYRFPQPLLGGVLIKRYKRFLADIILDNGQEITAHCPNSGSMLGCAPAGAAVAVSCHDSGKRRTAYTWQMVRVNGVWVGVNTGLPNLLAAQAARLQLGPFQTTLAVKTEAAVKAGTRLDLLATTAQGLLYAEVKSVTLIEGRQALFPDAITARGRKHLEVLTELKAAGHRALLIYLVQRQDADCFTLASHFDPDYAAAMAAAVKAGVVVAVWQAKVSLKGIFLWRRLPWNQPKSGLG
jgi:sugar fermentation stimulation protein A